MDMKEMREIVEDARRRGLIRAAGDPAAHPPPQPGPKMDVSVLPDWLQEGLLKPAPRDRFQ
jgi:hypothetical protein